VAGPCMGVAFASTPVWESTLGSTNLHADSNFAESLSAVALMLLL
jgi:hypothetical protein